MIKRLKVSDITKLYDLVAADYTVYSPKQKNGVLALLKSDKFHLDSLSKFQTIMPAKEILLGEIYNIEEDPKPQKIAFFGLHLCDVKAIKILDKLFAKDPFYQANRKDSLLVATDCQPTNNCFCQVFEANKHQGYDLFIQEEANGDYLVFAKSERAVHYLDQIKAKSVIAKANAVGHPETDFDLKRLTDAISDRKRFEKEWQMVANNCFGCGACTKVCPLCFCFDNVDRTDPKTGDCHRSRIPDSCFFSNFSKISNHDFRAKNVDRLYNWYHHKFVRQPAHSGDYLCTGCGRCIIACPAYLNIKKILGTFNKLTDKNGLK